MANVQERLGNNEENSAKKGSKYHFYRNLFMYSDRLQDRIEQHGKDMQDYLCELMNVYQSYHDLATQQYVLRGSKIRCRYGTKPALMDTISDHGVYMHGIPVMTCRDCRSWNIHNFGSCMCPESLYENRLPMPAERNARGEVAKRAPYNKFPHICVPVIDVVTGWQQEESSLKIDDGENMGDALTDKAALVCRYGGFIQVVEVTRPQDSINAQYTSLGELLYQIEMPYSRDDYLCNDKGTKIGVKPQNANDGYVTIGAGHCIQDDTEAAEYGFQTGEKQKLEDVDQCIKEQLAQYGETLDNPAILTMDEARLLLEADIQEYREKAKQIITSMDIDHQFTNNEIDAITSVLFNGTHINDKDSFSYYLLRPNEYDADDALGIIRKADESGWYHDNEGLLRRRLMEFNIYYNNDYSFYDLNRLEELKNAVGWYQ